MKSADILIVDDDAQVIRSIERTLQRCNYTIVSAQSGETALGWVAERAFKLIIADVKMNKMDGIELLQKVHETNPEISRMVLSGHADVALILRLVNRHGIDKYLIKPWENDDLVLAVATCVEWHDLRRAASSAHFLDRP